MNDILLIVAGTGGIAISVIHGYLGYKVVLPSVSGGTMPLRRVNSAVFQMSTLYWLAGGLLLIAAPFVLDQNQKRVVVCIMAFTYATGAIGNFWATRGRHPGWALLAIVTCMLLPGV